MKIDAATCTTRQEMVRKSGKKPNGRKTQVKEIRQDGVREVRERRRPEDVKMYGDG